MRSRKMTVSEGGKTSRRCAGPKRRAHRLRFVVPSYVAPYDRRVRNPRGRYPPPVGDRLSGAHRGACSGRRSRRRRARYERKSARARPRRSVRDLLRATALRFAPVAYPCARGREPARPHVDHVSARASLLLVLGAVVLTGEGNAGAGEDGRRSARRRGRSPLVEPGKARARAAPGIWGGLLSGGVVRPPSRRLRSLSRRPGPQPGARPGAAARPRAGRAGGPARPAS